MDCGERSALPLELLGSLNGIIGQNAVGTRPLESKQALENDFAAVEPAVLDGRLKHGVFAGDLVGVSGYAELIFYAADNVQNREDPV